MQTYPIPMIPGPVRVPDAVLKAYQIDYGSADLEPEFLELYNHAEAGLQQILATKNKVAIFTSEGMLALWAGLKSCLKPGERVLCLGTGVFGYGVADMARQAGADVRVLGTGYDETLHDWDAIEREIVAFKPKMITAVHCETPSGTLNPLAEVGRLKNKHGVPLFYVDAVASLAGAPVLTDEWSIDLLLGGTQKALSVPPALSFVAISEAAWEAARVVNYAGYDALLGFEHAQRDFYFPHTPYWHGIAALQAGIQLVLDEGLPQVYARHEMVAAYCREQLQEIGYELFPRPGAINAPTVTAAKVPERLGWEKFNQLARQKGLAVGGSYGPLTGKVFRLGHMGSQADRKLVGMALEVLKEVMNAE